MKTKVITFCFWVICYIGLSQGSNAILPLEELNSPIIHSAYLDKMKN